LARAWTELKTNGIRLRWSSRQRGRARWEVPLQFLLAVFLFVVVVGVLDARIGWPKPKREPRP